MDGMVAQGAGWSGEAAGRALATAGRGAEADRPAGDPAAGADAPHALTQASAAAPQARRAVRRRHWSLRTQLRAIGLLALLGMVAIALVAAVGLWQTRAVTERVVRHTAALSLLQTADMAHDGLRADAYAALLLLGERGRSALPTPALPRGLVARPSAPAGAAAIAPAGAAVLTSAGTAVTAPALGAAAPASAAARTPEAVRQDAFNQELMLRDAATRLLAAPVDADLHAGLQACHGAVDAYLDEARALLDAALAGQAEATGPALVRFERRYDELMDLFDAQTRRLRERNEQAVQAADAVQRRAGLVLLGTAALVLPLVGLLMTGLVRAIRRALRRIEAVAQAIADGEVQRRCEDDGRPAERDELGRLGAAVNRVADTLGSLLGQARAERDQHGFGRELSEAFEMADAEPEAYAVVQRAMARVAADRPMELLVADSSQAALQRATEHPVAGAPGCTVEHPFACQAVRRGAAVVHADSRALAACPHLSGRRDTGLGPPADQPRSAACVPLHFMGKALGVLHASGPVGQVLDAVQLQRLSELGGQAATRIGVVRAFQRTQLHAATDAATGLANRRALEATVRELMRRKRPFALLMADLDHFKRLNDTHGHLVGDEALRLFADTLRGAVRDTDTVARWGGEEFCLVLVGSRGEDALAWANRARQRLAQALEGGRVPRFTASFGVSDSTLAEGYEALLRIADEALYRAKAAGRDRAVLGPVSPAEALPLRQASEHEDRIDMAQLRAVV